MTLVEALGVGDVVALVGGAAIPPETTLVVPVVDADVFGQPLDAEHVHRPELVERLRLLREPAIESVVLGAARGDEPMLEVCARREQTFHSGRSR